MKPRVGAGPYARLDLAIPSTPANSFITDIGIWFVRERGNWLPAATWVSLLGALEIPASSARTALHRMTKADYLQQETRSARRGYSMSHEWIGYLRHVHDGLPSALLSQDPDPPGEQQQSEDKWTLLTFSIPETRRAERHAIRTLLGRNGFASLGNGVWIASVARLPETRVALEATGFADYVDMFRAQHEGFGELAEFVARCWDTEAIATMYRTFIRDVRRRIRRDPTADARTFADIIIASNNWRRINFTDPALPTAALPREWPRTDAERLFSELLARSLDPAQDYVESMGAS